MNIEMIPDHILEDLRERGNSDERIAKMSAVEAFSEYCEWQGLIGFGRPLFRAVEALKVAE